MRLEIISGKDCPDTLYMYVCYIKYPSNGDPRQETEESTPSNIHDLRFPRVLVGHEIAANKSAGGGGWEESRRRKKEKKTKRPRDKKAGGRARKRARTGGPPR